VDAILVHSFTPDHRPSDIAQHHRLDSYTRDPEPLQDRIQIGDLASVVRGPRRGLVGRIMLIEPPFLEVEYIGNMRSVEHDEFGPHTIRPIEPAAPDELPPQDDIIEHEGYTLVRIYADDAETQAPSTLTYSHQNGYDVTVGDIVEVARGQNWGRMGVVIRVDFRSASIEIGCDGAKVCIDAVFPILPNPV